MILSKKKKKSDKSPKPNERVLFVLRIQMLSNYFENKGLVLIWAGFLMSFQLYKVNGNLR